MQTWTSLERGMVYGGEKIVQANVYHVVVVLCSCVRCALLKTTSMRHCLIFSSVLLPCLCLLALLPHALWPHAHTLPTVILPSLTGVVTMSPDLLTLSTCPHVLALPTHPILISTHPHRILHLSSCPCPHHPLHLSSSRPILIALPQHLPILFTCAFH